MTQTYLRYLVTAVLAYLVFYRVMVYLVGFTAAIAIPDGYFVWFDEHSATWLGMVVWNLLTLSSVKAIISFAVSFLATRYTGRSWLPLSLLMIAIHLAYFYIVLFVHIRDSPQMIEQSGWTLFVPGIAPILFMSLGCWFGQRLRDRAGRGRITEAHAL